MKVPDKYVNFAFSPDLASELPDHTEINDHSIKLVDANGCIRLSKSPGRSCLSGGPDLNQSQYETSRASLDLPKRFIQV